GSAKARDAAQLARFVHQRRPLVDQGPSLRCLLGGRGGQEVPDVEEDLQLELVTLEVQVEPGHRLFIPALARPVERLAGRRLEAVQHTLAATHRSPPEASEACAEKTSAPGPSRKYARSISWSSSKWSWK